MADFDRLKAALARFVEQVMSRVDYLALYPCRVVAQNEDGTLELKPDATTFGAGLSRVPLRLGIPGVTVKVKQQARVLLGFEGGDPQRPIATLWESGGLDEITVTATTKVTVSAKSVVLAQVAGSARPVAVVGSIVKATFIAPGPIPPGAPCEGVGYITDGVPAVLAG